MVPGDSLALWPDVFHLTFVSNPGVAFGLLAGNQLILAMFSLAVTVAIICYGPWYTRDIPHAGWFLGLLAGGALGNAIDRLFRGEVTDFLDFRIWPVFNLADCAIVVGAGLLLLNIIRYSQGARG